VKRSQARKKCERMPGLLLREASAAVTRQQTGNIDDEKMTPPLQWQEDDDVMPPLHDRSGYESDSSEDVGETATGRIKVAFKGLAAPRMLSTQPVTGASKKRHRLENK